MTYSASVTAQGQMTIPVRVQNMTGIKKNTKVHILVKDKKMIVEPIPNFRELFGVFKTNKKIPFKVARKKFEEYLAHEADK